MVAQSKPEAPSAERKAELARKWRITYIRQLGVAMNFFAWLMMIPARPEMVLKVSGGDPGVASRALASMTGATSAVEFFMAGLLGRLSDRYGRKPIMVGAPIICFLARMVTFAAAIKDGGRNRAWIVGANWIDRAVSGSAFPVYLMTNAAASADLWMKDPDQTILPRLAAMGASIAGISIALAPFSGARIMAKTGSVKWVPLASGGVSLLHAMLNYFLLTETLPAALRRPFKWSGASPVAFTQFFTQSGRNGRRMRILAIALLLGALRADMHDTRMVMLKTKLGFGPKEIGNYMLASGGSVMLQGHASAQTMRLLGMNKHTYLATLSAILEQLAWSVATGASGIGVACLCGVLGHTWAAGISHTLAKTGEESLGIGRGQLNAMFSNMNTIAKIPGPLIFATAFGKFGQPAPFRLSAALLGCAGLAFSLLPPEPKKEQPAEAARREQKGGETAKAGGEKMG